MPDQLTLYIERPGIMPYSQLFVGFECKARYRKSHGPTPRFGVEQFCSLRNYWISSLPVTAVVAARADCRAAAGAGFENYSSLLSSFGTTEGAPLESEVYEIVEPRRGSETTSNCTAVGRTGW